MANMSYCRFENTSNDLDDCKAALENILDGEHGDAQDSGGLGDHELPAAKRLVATALEIVLRMAEEAGVELEGLGDYDAERLLAAAVERANKAFVGARECAYCGGPIMDGFEMVEGEPCHRGCASKKDGGAR